MLAAAVTALIVVVAYFLGSIPFGLVIAKTQGMDIREHGSRNIGATNVSRVLGRKWGLLTFFCDAAKGWMAVVLAREISSAAHPPVFDDPAFAGIWAALGCVIGHNFPVWLRFKGGKGVATSLGVIFGMMPLVSAIVLGIWGLLFKMTRYVSLASRVAAVALPVTVLGLMFVGPATGPLAVRGWASFYFACAAALLVVIRHRENIKRLMEGTENRFGPKDDEETPKA